MTENKMLIPTYIKDFKCIGKDCEDSCCDKKWGIFIDKKTFSKYRKVNNSEIKSKLDKYIKRNRRTTNSEDYAKIVITKNKCPMLAENKTCEIYTTLGEGFLSNVCTIYPRHYNNVDNVYEKSLALSCPEAARMILLKEDGIDFEYCISNNEKMMVQKTINTATFTNALERNFWDLRMFTIELLQNRKYSIEERLTILGLFFSAIQKNKENKSTQELITEYKLNIENNLYDDVLNGVNYNQNIQIKILTHLQNHSITKRTLDDKYVNKLKKVSGGLEFEKNDINYSIEKYNDARMKHYNNVMNNHSHMLENYLVNDVFRTLFPLSKEVEPFDIYINLCTKFALLKMNLIGYSAYYKEDFTVEKVIDMICSFSSATDHRNDLIYDIVQLLEENKIKTLAHMIVLLGE